jgi:phosphoglycolate phosphatase
MSPAPTLVLDLDGTLVDTASDLTATLNDILAQEGLPAVSPDEGRAMVGHGARAMLSNALLSAGITAEPDRLDNLVALFIDIYAGRIAETSRPFPGVPEALDRFAADGWRLAVCTNKFERHSRLLLRELGLADRFTVIAGQDTYGVRKPDARHLLETIREAGGSSAAAVMVGDSEVDVQTARSASVPVVAVDFGYCRVPVQDLAPDRVISHFDALYAAATGLLGRT